MDTEVIHMGAGKMAEYLDFFNVYVMGVIEMAFQLYFLGKILKKKISLPFYFLFAVCAVIVCDFVPTSTITGFAALVFLLTACGILVCHADVKSSILYAALAVEIMLLCYGIVKSILALLRPWMPVVFHDMDGIAVMLVSEAASLALSGFCYYVVYRYFSCYSAAEMQQMFLVIIPILMIFIMSEYINTVEFECQFEVLAEGGPSGDLFSHWHLLVIHLLGLLSLFCILFSYKKLQQNFRLNTKISLLEQEEHTLNQYVEETKTRYDRTKSFRHDIRLVPDAYIWDFGFHCLSCRREYKFIFITQLLSGDTHSSPGNI